MLSAFRPQDNEAANDKSYGHRNRLEQDFLDCLAEQQAQDRDRKKSNKQFDREALCLRITTQPRDDRNQSRPIFPNDSQNRATLDHDLKQLAFLGIEIEKVACQD